MRLRSPTVDPLAPLELHARKASVAQEERRDRLHPATAGLLTGALAGPLMLMTADGVASILRGLEGALFPPVWALCAAALAGALVGCGFALLTRHLRKFGPLLLWSLVFFPALATFVDAFVLGRLQPPLRAGIPALPMIAGAAVFAIVVALELPLRRRSAPLPAQV